LFSSDTSNFIGNDAGGNSGYATFSNFIGRGAGAGTFSATNSNYIGSFAGNFSRGAGVNAIGYRAGWYQDDTGDISYSNFIGWQAGIGLAGPYLGRNNIIIGTSISLPEASHDSINIGGVLFGINTHFNSTELVTPLTQPTTNGKIGIGVVVPLNRLHVTDTSDPLRLGGLQKLNTDSEVLTTDTNGVIHKRPYDYVTGFTYTSSSNTFTITTTSGNSYSAQINQMSGLTIDGNLTVLGNYVVSGDTIISGNTIFSGTTTMDSVPNAIGDFLTLPTSNIVSRRTSHEVRDDIGYYGLTFAIMNGYY
jgi:hypothetical protein